MVVQINIFSSPNSIVLLYCTKIKLINSLSSKETKRLSIKLLKWIYPHCSVHNIADNKIFSSPLFLCGTCICSAFCRIYIFPYFQHPGHQSMTYIAKTRQHNSSLVDSNRIVTTKQIFALWHAIIPHSFLVADVKPNSIKLHVMPSLYWAMAENLI